MKIEFVDYNGRYPNLCGGILILRIDGEIYSFGGYYPFEDPSHEFDSFWTSGGSVWFSSEWDEHVESGPWVLSGELPEFLKGHEKELIDIMNDNVPHGCCGGCV